MGWTKYALRAAIIKQQGMVNLVLLTNMVKKQIINLIEISELPSGLEAESCLAINDLARVKHSHILSVS